MKKPPEEDLRKLKESVDKFADLMWNKLSVKYWQGYEGWDSAKNMFEMQGELGLHAAKLIAGDYEQGIDVANFAMFLYFLGEATTDVSTTDAL